MNTIIYLEGGGESKELHARCREGFRRLLERCGFAGRMPRLVACGGRNQCFGDFLTQHQTGDHRFVGLWIDSEEPVADVERTWAHLQQRDHWIPPAGATDEQVLFMATCMETWIAADRPILREHYGHALQVSALPPLENLEQRPRHSVQDALSHATRNCSNAYKKGKRSFDVLGMLTPAALKEHLPCFVRLCRILDVHL